MKLPQCVLPLCVLVALCLAAPASAAPITFRFAGSVDSTWGGAPSPTGRRSAFPLRGNQHAEQHRLPGGGLGTLRRDS